MNTQILFNSVMNIARKLGATSFSLEVRVSNIPAQKSWKPDLKEILVYTHVHSSLMHKAKGWKQPKCLLTDE